MNKIIKFVGVAISFATLIFYHFFKMKKVENELLKGRLKDVEKREEITKEIVNKKNSISRGNAVNDVDVVDRLRSKKYFRD